MSIDLTQKNCVPCKIGTPPLSQEEINQLLPQISTWNLDQGKLKKEFKFKDFKVAMEFVNRLADLAETEGHHPNIFISYNKVKIILFTHVAHGLTENDFILAAKIDLLP